MLVFKNALLIDGTGADAIEGATVIIEGKKIKAAGVDIDIPEGAQVIDLQGKTLLPGFSDAHTHVGGSSSLERPGSVNRFDGYDYAEFRNAMLYWGVTAVRSAGDFTPDILDVRDAINNGIMRGPRILAAGKMLQAKGGHPLSSVYFDDPAIGEGVCVLIDDDTDVEQEVKKLANLGVDWIKAVVSDDNKMRYPCTVPRISNEQLRRIVDAAHSYGKPVMMHADDIGNMIDALKAGADTVEHVINVATSDHEITQELLEHLTQREVWSVPTLVASRNHDGSIERAPLVWETLKEAIRKIIASGVKIGVGCDSGIPFVPFGETVHTEMELLVDAGMSPLEAVCAATGGNAKMMRCDNEFGTITPGLDADIVILGSSPLDDIKNTKDIKLVMREGAIVIDRLLSV